MAVIISEGTQPSADGQGYPLTPGIYSAAQIAGWRLVSDAVHVAAEDHHPVDAHRPNWSSPQHLARTSARCPVESEAGRSDVTSVGTFEMPPPRSLTEDEIAGTVRDFRHARGRLEAGADGVEIHARTVISSTSFFRTMPTNARMATGVRSRIEFASRSRCRRSRRGNWRRAHRHHHLTRNPLNDILEEDVDDLYSVLLRALSPLGLAYLNVVHGGNEDLIDAIRRDWDLLCYSIGAEPTSRPGSTT